MFVTRKEIVAKISKGAVLAVNEVFLINGTYVSPDFLKITTSQILDLRSLYSHYLT